MGESVRDVIEERIDSSRQWAAPLKPYTIERKGHDQPLIDTEEMYDSITIRVDGK